MLLPGEPLDLVLLLLERAVEALHLIAQQL